MEVLESYLLFLNEDIDDDEEVKIHPKRKTAMSVAALANPVDDVVFGGTGALVGVKAAQKASTLKKIGSGAVGIGIGIVSSAALMAGYRSIRSVFDKCTKDCGTFSINTPHRQLCMLQCKLKALEQKEKLLAKEKIDQNKIQEVQQKINIVNKKIKLYEDFIKKEDRKKEIIKNKFLNKNKREIK